MSKVTRRNAIMRMTLFPALASGWSVRGATLNSFSDQPSIAKEHFSRLRRAGERMDLRLLILDAELLRERVRKGVYAVGSFLEDIREEKAEAGLVIEEVLRRSSWRLLNKWRGVRPALILVKKDKVVLGNKTPAFLGLPLDAGDILIVGTID